VQRAEIRSPDNGVVNNLKVHAGGTVIPGGIILAEIVPQSEELIIESKVSPMDIDLVAVGQEATVLLSAFNSRTVPKLQGTVISLSADAILEPNGATYYLARLELTPDSMAALHGLPLVPGMPAEVFIKTGSRTFFQYLIKPLSDGMAHSFRED
jgi:membrane fusion protein, epimerase transport system